MFFVCFIVDLFSRGDVNVSDGFLDEDDIDVSVRDGGLSSSRSSSVRSFAAAASAQLNSLSQAVTTSSNQQQILLQQIQNAPPGIGNKRE